MGHRAGGYQRAVDMTSRPVATVDNGRYRLIEHLGAGGAAEVWRGHDDLLDRDVAIKVVEHEDLGQLPSLLNEAQSAARLHHPYITDVYDVGSQSLPSGRVLSYAVMELVDGVTLRTIIGPGRRTPWPEVTRIVAQVAEALAVAHANGVVHRDVSASNVMLTGHGIKVLDFGIAAALGSPECDQDGVVPGNVRYAAPERIAQPDRPVRPAGDIYSLGVLWYRLLAGAFPWTVSGNDEILGAHLDQAPNPLPASVGLPEPLRELCFRCLAKDPADRPTAAEIATSLSSFRGGAEAVDRSPPSPVDLVEPTRVLGLVRSPRRRAALVALALAIAAIAAAVSLAGGAVFDRPAPPSGRPPLAASPAVPKPPSIAASAIRPLASPTTSPESVTAPAVPTASPPGPVASTAPSPTASPSAPSPTAPGATEVSGLGGLVLARCVGAKADKAEIVQAIAAPGYTLDKFEPGPAKDARASFRAPGYLTDIRISCPKGVFTPHVRD